MNLAEKANVSGDSAGAKPELLGARDQNTLPRQHTISSRAAKYFAGARKENHEFTNDFALVSHLANVPKLAG
jgi:hypothetical protein